MRKASYWLKRVRRNAQKVNPLGTKPSKFVPSKTPVVRDKSTGMLLVGGEKAVEKIKVMPKGFRKLFLVDPATGREIGNILFRETSNRLIITNVSANPEVKGAQEAVGLVAREIIREGNKNKEEVFVFSKIPRAPEWYYRKR